ncbi:hypothetical protein [Halobacterium sp. KA-6]|uniref:hypothetical protein n=1 Tax=Halobacterium sp. KA-6 TaxID=2896368 RepID=UPI001E646C8C|nr:hypothetical protein [Halobacterium sp. KA-6]MCD2202738.1 hypothetical protein [Halobacterium sp. KA-6]
MDTDPISAVEAVVFLALMLVILKIAVDALEAAPLGFSTQADDYLEDAADGASGVWEDYT